MNEIREPGVGWSGLRLGWKADSFFDMSAKAKALLEQIQSLPAAELFELCREVNRMAAETEHLSSAPRQVSNEEFEAALEEVTGATAGSNALERLLKDRRRDREQEEAYLEARRRNSARG
jgi:hypothetical protein